MSNQEPGILTFKVTAVERARAEHWGTYHGSGNGYCLKNGGEIGYEFRSGGGLGTTVIVKCLSCHQTLDVSDYDSW